MGLLPKLFSPLELVLFVLVIIVGFTAAMYFLPPVFEWLFGKIDALLRR